MPHTIRPGDLLAERYQMVDLLSESAGGRFWRAYDTSLDRSVAVHLIPSNDERAALLQAAARRSATVVDRRVLRVLDVNDADGQCYVVNEWGQGTSLDILLANQGPLEPRRAAWLVSEVAATIAVAHNLGQAHGRLVPENVLIDEAGSVRVIGFAVDAALHGLPAGRISNDVFDLAALLYVALTGKWPGISRSTVPLAPAESHTRHHRVLRPRQVRAGVPRLLDSLCDLALNPHTAPPGAHARGAYDLATASGICEALREYVGDSTELREAEVSTRDARPGPPVPNDSTVTFIPDFSAPAPVDQPTEAGMPVFDDSGAVEWFTASDEKPPPPPPFEDPPERPLFAPEPADGGPARRSRVADAPEPAEYWPWDTGTGAPSTPSGAIGVIDADDDEEVPGRSWLRLALLLGVGVLLLLATVMLYNVMRGKTLLGGETSSDTTTSQSPSPTTSATATAKPYTGLVATDFDPQGSPPEEFPELAELAVDGKPATGWHTEVYTQQLGPGGLKTGVGLTIDLGSSKPVGSVVAALAAGPAELNVYLTDTEPVGVRDLTPAGTMSATGSKSATLTLETPVAARFVTVWFTSLPPVTGGFRGQLNEVSIRP